MPTKRNESSTVFAADPEGWREQNAGRPAAHLLRELVQNVFDEAATGLSVELGSDSNGARFLVADNVPGGIRDERLIWTLFLSDKKDEPTKRGRMGRGLKELIAVADETLIRTQNAPALLFERVRGKWKRSNPKRHRTEVGTVVQGNVKAWKARDVRAAIEYLMRMRPPEGLAFSVNGERVERKPATETYQLKLPTVVYELEPDGRVERQRTCTTTVELFEELDDEGKPASWVYEMGVPVEPIDFPLSIDVAQRIPLREKRDTMTDPYRRELFAKLVDVRLPLMTPSQLRDNFVLTAAAASEHLSETTKRTISEAWTEGRAYATNPDTFRQATGMHIEAVNLRALPESIRDLTREVGVDVRAVMDNIKSAACREIPRDEESLTQRTFAVVWEHIAIGVRRPCRIVLMKGKPSSVASFDRDSKPLATLRVYVDNLHQTFTNTPLSAEALGLLIHELAHWTPHEHGHGFDFHSDAEDVGGAVAAYVFENADKLRGIIADLSGT